VAGGSKTKAVANALGNNPAAFIQDARHNAGIGVWDVTRHQAGAVLQGKPKHRGVVLDGNRLAAQLAGRGALDIAKPGDPPIQILCWAWFSSSASGVLHGPCWLWQRIQKVVRQKGALGSFLINQCLVCAELKTIMGRNLQNAFYRRSFNGHGLPLNGLSCLGHHNTQGAPMANQWGLS
jgi:hypothetical protein